MRFVTATYTGSILTLAAANLLPLLIVQLEGSVANSYFYLPWVIFGGIQLVAINLVSSFTVESAQNHEEVYRNCYGVLKATLGIILPIVAVIVGTAPLLLRFYGAAYEQEGTRLLQLMAVASLPYAIVLIYLGLARVRSQLRSIVAVQGVVCAWTLGGSYGFVRLLGIDGVGWALLTGYAILAVILLLTGLRPVLATARRSSPDRQQLMSSLS